MPVPELSCKFYVINPGVILPVKLSQSHNNDNNNKNVRSYGNSKSFRSLLAFGSIYERLFPVRQNPLPFRGKIVESLHRFFQCKFQTFMQIR